MAVGVVTVGAVAESVEEGGVVVEGFDEPTEKVTGVTEVLLDNGDELRPQGFEKPDGAEIGTGDVVETVVHPVNDGDLSAISRGECCRVGDVPYLALKGLELEGETQGGSEVGEAATGGFEKLDRRSKAGDAKGSDLGRARCEDVEEPRPLKPLHHIQIDDMHAILPFQRLKDRLIRREVRELHQWRDRVVGLERLRDPPALLHRQRFERQRRIGPKERAHDPGVQRLSEVRRHTLRR